MLRFVLKRLLQAIVTLWAIVTLTFVLTKSVPGDPFSQEKQISESTRAQLNAYYGLDQPVVVQYGLLFQRLFKGDLGPSMRQPGTTVNEIVRDSFPVSITLGVLSLAIALAVGIPAGILAAARKNTFFDYLPMGFAMAGICLPTFVLGPILSYVFGLKLQWLSVSGWSRSTDWILPASTLGLFYAAYVARIVRGGMLEVLGQDFIRTARAKGVGSLRLITRHTLRGGLMPLVSFLGPAIAGLVSGSFVIENIFRVPGLGKHFVQAAQAADYSVVIGTTLLFGSLIIVLNFLVDLIQALMDPRQRIS